jgi:hypothetical protein
MRTRVASSILCAVGLTLALTGCSSNPTGPSSQEIGNKPDNFQFEASNLSGTTQTSTYSWTNSGLAAMVNNSGQITAGDGTLILRDGSGKQVFSGTLMSTGTFASTGGTAGTWQIELHLTNVTGTVNFSVQRSN